MATLTDELERIRAELTHLVGVRLQRPGFTMAEALRWHELTTREVQLLNLSPN